jgi:EAL domain-containing protein (putative c-di-GMP-specific phosphodiesterase class I)
VNIPAVQLTDTHFADRVLSLLAEAGVDPAWLCLEVTEDALVEVAGPGLEMLGRLRKHGVHIALDDFGTGYSSLSQLRQLPVDMLKIDLSFIARLTHEPADATIVKTIIELAHGLGVEATAEGIETDEQIRALRRFGCDHGQGFRFARPMRADDLDGTLPSRVGT